MSMRVGCNLSIHAPMALKLQKYKQGYMFIACPDCHKTTLHKPVKQHIKGRGYWAKYCTVYECTQCGHRMEWKKGQYPSRQTFPVVSK